MPLSKHVHDLLTSLVSTETSLQEKHVHAAILQDFVTRPDAYIEFSNTQCEAQLPPLEWNRHFKKAYTILCWIRPIVHVHGDVIPSTTTPHHYKQVLYRFCTSDKDYKGAGLCVQLGDWTHPKQRHTLYDSYGIFTSHTIPTNGNDTIVSITTSIATTKQQVAIAWNFSRLSLSQTKHVDNIRQWNCRGTRRLGLSRSGQYSRHGICFLIYKHWIRWCDCA